MMRTQVTDALTTSLSPKRMLLAVVVLLVPMSVLVSAGGHVICRSIALRCGLMVNRMKCRRPELIQLDGSISLIYHW